MSNIVFLAPVPDPSVSTTMYGRNHSAAFTDEVWIRGLIAEGKAAYQGTPVGHSGMPFRGAAVRDIRPAAAPDLQRMQLDLLKQVNQRHLDQSGPDPALEGRINSFELAYRMQAEAPCLMDLSGETKETLALYGIGDERLWTTLVLVRQSDTWRISAIRNAAPRGK